MTDAMLWTEGAAEELRPWTGGRAVAWVGPVETAVRLPSNAVDRADAAPLPPGARSAFLQRRLLLRFCVARWLDLTAETVEVAYDAFRRPVLRRPRAGLSVSAASRAGVFAVALAEGSVGIDVELATGTGIAAAALTAEEARRLADLQANARETAFLALWTAKEAYLKAIGLGFARDPASIAIAIDSGGCVTVEDDGRRVPLRCGASRTVVVGTRAVQAACIVR